MNTSENQIELVAKEAYCAFKNAYDPSSWSAWSSWEQLSQEVKDHWISQVNIIYVKMRMVHLNHGPEA